MVRGSTFAGLALLVSSALASSFPAAHRRHHRAAGSPRSLDADKMAKYSNVSSDIVFIATTVH